MLLRRSRSAPAVLTLLATLLIAAPVAAQSGPSAEREAAEDALADAQRLADGRGLRTGRELTIALLEVARRRDALARSDRDEADALLARPTDYDDTGQTAGPYDESARVLRTCSTHFCVHWVNTTADAPPLAEANSCSAPDYVDHVVTALEQSYAVENGQLGWHVPKSDGALGGDARTDVYLKNLNDPGSINLLYGYAATDPNQSTFGQWAFMVLDNDYAEFTDYPTYVEPAEVTAAHEYNHVLQYAYDVTQDPWMYESTATWAEEKVFPADDDYVNYMDTWASSPGTPITTPSGSRKYGTAVWNHFLEQRYGADVIERAWLKSLSSGTASMGFAPQAYDLAIKDEPTGSSFEANFGDFAAATAAWQVPDSGFHEGASFPPVHRRDSLAIGTTRPVTALNHTGYALFDVPVPTGASTPIRLTQSLPVGTPSGPVGTIALVGVDAQGEVTKVVARPGTDGNASVVLENPSQFEEITAVVANADTSKSGFNTNTNDWVWTRDNQTVSITLSSAPGATGPQPVDEPRMATPTSPPPGTVCGQTAVEHDPPVTPTPIPSASTTPTPTPTATATVTPPPPPPATSLRLTRNSSRIGSVLRKGVLSLFVQANKAGRHSVRATVDAATAKRLNVGRRTTKVGSGSRTASAPARLKVNVKLTRKLRAALKRNRKRSVKLTIAVAFTPADGTAAVRETLRVRLKP
jgi:hypothetical protein